MSENSKKILMNASKKKKRLTRTFPPFSILVITSSSRAPPDIVIVLIEASVELIQKVNDLEWCGISDHSSEAHDVTERERVHPIDKVKLKLESSWIDLD